MAAVALVPEAAIAVGDVKEPVKIQQQDNARDWKLLTELVLKCRSQVALGPAEVERAHAESLISIIFLSEGKFPQVEALLPRMKAAGFVCHVVDSGHALSSEVDKHGLAAILHKPFSSPPVIDSATSDKTKVTAPIVSTEIPLPATASVPSLEPALVSTVPLVGEAKSIEIDSTSNSTVAALPQQHPVPAEPIRVEAPSTLREPPPPPPPPPPPSVVPPPREVPPPPREVPPPTKNRSRSPRPRVVLPPKESFVPEAPEPYPTDVGSTIKSTPAAIAAAPWRRSSAPEPQTQSDFNHTWGAKSPPPVPPTPPAPPAPPPPPQTTYNGMDPGPRTILPKKSSAAMPQHKLLGAAVAKAPSWDTSWDAQSGPSQSGSSWNSNEPASLNQASVLGSTESPWEFSNGTSSSTGVERWSDGSSGQNSSNAPWPSQPASWEGGQSSNWSAQPSQTTASQWESGTTTQDGSWNQPPSQQWESGAAQSSEHWQGKGNHNSSWSTNSQSQSENWENSGTSQTNSWSSPPPPQVHWESGSGSQQNSWSSQHAQNSSQDWENNNGSNSYTWSTQTQATANATQMPQLTAEPWDALQTSKDKDKGKGKHGKQDSFQAGKDKGKGKHGKQGKSKYKW